MEEDGIFERYFIYMKQNAKKDKPFTLNAHVGDNTF
ncbi:hypothetical protein J2750_001304 [Methanococcoides alaskense]|uniref:Uncharacterized protein n=1 Tax=Methanococcoides alaskense TaxID=325778 RepID=A0AA90Z872_9EURY|nr:hypothetical protein [Methanococcoides alaskense]